MTSRWRTGFGRVRRTIAMNAFRCAQFLIFQPICLGRILSGWNSVSRPARRALHGRGVLRRRQRLLAARRRLHLLLGLAVLLNRLLRVRSRAGPLDESRRRRLEAAWFSRCQRHHVARGGVAAVVDSRPPSLGLAARWAIWAVARLWSSCDNTIIGQLHLPSSGPLVLQSDDTRLTHVPAANRGGGRADAAKLASGTT